MLLGADILLLDEPVGAGGVEGAFGPRDGLGLFRRFSAGASMPAPGAVGALTSGAWILRVWGSWGRLRLATALRGFGGRGPNRPGPQTRENTATGRPANGSRCERVKQNPATPLPQTNHLDTANVEWLEEWLVAQRRVTLVTVSHDAAFLDAVCTGEGGGRPSQSPARTPGQRAPAPAPALLL
jgi:hypothetical protein